MGKLDGKVVLITGRQDRSWMRTFLIPIPGGAGRPGLLSRFTGTNCKQEREPRSVRNEEKYEPYETGFGEGRAGGFADCGNVRRHENRFEIRWRADWRDHLQLRDRKKVAEVT